MLVEIDILIEVKMSGVVLLILSKYSIYIFRFYCRFKINNVFS